MISCDCYDYKHGHLCKHTHRIHRIQQLSSCGEENVVSDDECKKIGVTPSRERRSEAGIFCFIHMCAGIIICTVHRLRGKEKHNKQLPG